MVAKNLRIWIKCFEEALQASGHLARFLCLLHVTNKYICTAAIPLGPSMVPNLNLTGDFVLAERISTWTGKVGRRDMVLVRSPENPNKVVIKRIVGIEGDTVTYLVRPKHSDESNTIVVPKGKVWIEGDNIYDSRDSRYFGAVPYGLVEGKLFWRIWPPKYFGSLSPKQQ